MDSDGTIVEVRFYEATNLLGIVTQPPYNLFLTNILSQRNDYYWLTATAKDDGGLISTSQPVRLLITQDPLPPRVSLDQPKNGEIFSFPTFLDVWAIVINYDGSENPVQLFSGTNLIGTVDAPLYSIPVTNPPAPQIPYVATYYSLTASNLPIGQHILTARYTDNAGNKGTSQPVSITISPLFLSSASVLPDGHLQFDVMTSFAGQPNVVQASTNLLDWTPIGTNTPSSNTFTFTDSSAATNSQRFYRVIVPP